MSKIILISPNYQMVLKVSQFSSNQGCEFQHYTEEEWNKEKHKQKSNVLSFTPQKYPLPEGRTHQNQKKLDDIVYESIKNTLHQNKGNVIQTCKALQISRSTLYRKIIEFEIDLNIIRHQTRKKRKLKKAA